MVAWGDGFEDWGNGVMGKWGIGGMVELQVCMIA
jgi:hypothetical protein